MKIRYTILLLMVSLFYLPSTSLGDGLGIANRKAVGLQTSAQMAVDSKHKGSDEKGALTEQKENEQLKHENDKLFAENIKLGIEAAVFSQSHKTYDSFLGTVVVVLTLFSLLWTGGAVLIGILGYKNIREIRDNVEKEVNDIQRRSEEQLNNKVTDEVNKIVDITMKKTSEEPLNILTQRVNSLEDYLEELLKAIKNKSVELPSYIEKEEPTITERKNIFEENENE